MYQSTEVSYTTFDSGNFTLSEKDIDVYQFYVYGHNDFLLEGDSAYGEANLLVHLSGANHTYKIAEVVSGKTIISGYEYYDTTDLSEDGTYVYARKAGGGMDIYLVK